MIRKSIINDMELMDEHENIISKFKTTENSISIVQKKNQKIANIYAND